MQVDEELRKAFSELQMKMIDVKHRLTVADLEIDKFSRMQQYTDIVIKDVDNLKKGTRLFYSIGRMYLLEDDESVKKILKTKKEYASNRIKDIEKGIHVMEKNLKDSEKSLRELVEQKRRS